MPAATAARPASEGDDVAAGASGVRRRMRVSAVGVVGRRELGGERGGRRGRSSGRSARHARIADSSVAGTPSTSALGGATASRSRLQHELREARALVRPAARERLVEDDAERVEVGRRP